MNTPKIRSFIYLWAVTLLLMSYAQIYCFYCEIEYHMVCDLIKHASILIPLMFLLNWSNKSFRESLNADNEEKGVSKSILNYLYLLCSFMIWIRILWAFSITFNIIATISVSLSLIVNIFFTILLISRKFNK